MGSSHKVIEGKRRSSRFDKSPLTELTHNMKAFLAISCLLATAFADEAYVKTHLTGHWKENQYQRNGLNNFLYEMGMNWFKRVYVTSASWENQQHITYSQAGNPTWSVSGIKGPREDAFNFDLVPDYNTQTSVDLGQGQIRRQQTHHTHSQHQDWKTLPHCHQGGKVPYPLGVRPVPGLTILQVCHPSLQQYQTVREMWF